MYSSIFRCDGWTQCDNSEDEKDCPIRECNEDEWRCNDGQCIAEELKCDMWSTPDCQDGSDERDENCAPPDY